MITFKKNKFRSSILFFFSNMTNIKSFDSNLLSIDKISNKNTDAVSCIKF